MTAVETAPIIGVEGRSLLGEPTGVGRYVRNILTEMIEIDPRLRFRLFLDREAEDGFEGVPRVERIRLPGGRGRNVFFWTHRDVPRLLRRDPVALMHFPFYTLPLSLPCPAVVTIHDITFTMHPEWFAWRSRIAFGAFARRSARRAVHVLTVSECSRRDLIGRYGLDPSRVTAVPLAADPRFTPRPREEVEAVQRRHDIGPPYLIHLGSLHPRRNLERLLDAVASLGRPAAGGARAPAAGAAIAGAGSAFDPGSAAVTLVLAGRVERPYLSVEPMIRARGLEGRVKHLGYVSDSDLPALLTGASALVYPSLYEGFGLPVLEAMACGTPVVTSSVSALPETAGEAAILVDPLSTEAIARCLHDVLTGADLRVRMREAGLARARSFSWRRTAEGTLEVYRFSLAAASAAARRAAP